MPRHALVALSACFALAVTSSCGGGGRRSTPGDTPGGADPGGTAGDPGGGTTEPGASSALRVAGVLAAAKGETVQLTALASDAAAVERDCSPDAVWSSSDPAVATVAGRTATALGEGTTTITASYDGLTATAQLVVGEARPVSLEVTPAQGSLPLGFREQLAATAILTDGTRGDVTARVGWSSSDEAVLQVSSAGVATPVARGTATVTAALAGVAPVAVARTVVEATLQSIAVSPLAASAPLGTTVQFRAAGTFSDQVTADITPSVTWTSSDAAAVAFGNAPADPPGLATALLERTATITAEAAGASPASTSLTVTAPTVVSIAISPLAPTLVAGDALQLTGQATYTDDSVVDGVPLSGWTSSVPSVATVSEGGLLTAVAAGTATILATHTASGLAARTAVTVVPRATPVLSYLSLSRGSVKGGPNGTATATVHLTAPAEIDALVSLASDSAFASVPQAVTIPAGATTATFEVVTTSPEPARKAKATIRATLDGVTKSATLNVRR